MLATVDRVRAALLWVTLTLLGLLTVTLQGCGDDGNNYPSYAELRCEHAVNNAISHISKRGDMLLTAACNLNVAPKVDGLEDIQNRCFDKCAKSMADTRAERKPAMVSTCAEEVSGKDVSNLELDKIVDATMKLESETKLMAATERSQFLQIQKAKDEAEAELTALRGDGTTTTPANLFATTTPANLFATTEPQSLGVTDAEGSGSESSSGSASGSVVIRYLPMVLDGATVLRKITGQTPTAPGTYQVDNTELQSASPGLGYRVSKEIGRMAKDHQFAHWGSDTQGFDEGDGWIRCTLKNTAASQQSRPSIANSEEVRTNLPSTTTGQAQENIETSIDSEEARANDDTGSSLRTYATLGACLTVGTLVGSGVVFASAALTKRNAQRERSLLSTAEPRRLN